MQINKLSKKGSLKGLRSFRINSSPSPSQGEGDQGGEVFRQPLKLALPKGQLQGSTAALLKKAGFAISNYRQASRSYRPSCPAFPGLFFKVLQEKDIAIQVAIGNYDLGICGLDWIEELLAKYSSGAVVKVRDLGYGRRTLYAAVSNFSKACSLEALRSSSDNLRIVSEYPNLAESFALKHRLRRFQIFPVWGAAEVYLPENADIAIIVGTSVDRLSEGLVPVATLLGSSAFLIANRNSLERKDLSRVLAPLSCTEVGDADVEELLNIGAETEVQYSISEGALVFLALPDGHQQRPAIDFLNKAGLKIKGYHEAMPTRRPQIDLDGVVVKVVRPQDMPLQVANGNFDLAITGKDWLWDHLCRFPSSPVAELLDLGFGKVRVVAVVSKDLPVSSTDDLRKRIVSEKTTYPRFRYDSFPQKKVVSALRLASEYVNIADKYARDNHLAPYKLIPTWGASEAFLPEDADVLIENTETGSTLSRHNLKIIDTLFESSACLMGNTEVIERPDKREKIAYLIETLRRGVEASPVF